MSQHLIDGRDPKHTVIVGYDRPLDNFFAQVWGKSDNDDTGPILWVEGEATPDAMADALIDFAEVPGELRLTLANERNIGGVNSRLDHRTIRE